jgi:hypothetical protein
MPEKLPDSAIQTADAAVAYARQVRGYHARRTAKASPQRRTDIEVALKRLREAMAPLKSEIGRFPYGPQTDTAEANRERIRCASAAIQAERRKLWKMKKERG